MSRTLSDRFVRGLMAQHSDLAIVKLLTITHPDLAVPILVCDYETDLISKDPVTHADRYFQSFRFNCSLPEDTDENAPKMKITIYNVTGQILQQIRPLVKSPSILLEIIYDKYPDDIEASFPDFQLTSVQFSVLTISGDLTVDDFLNQQWPEGTFNPTEFHAVVP
jgi:hypothetical protein